MRITFPHIGNAHIAIKSLLQGLNLEVIPPPPITKKTLELGIKYSPEFACMPLKINMGNFIEALDLGADTILMAGGWGPCRFGYYAQVQRDILLDMGYNFQMVVLEAPDSKFSGFVKQLKSLGNNVTLWQAIKAIRFAWFKLCSIEKIEKLYEYYLPRVVDKDEADCIINQALLDMDKATSKSQINECMNKLELDFKKLKKHNQPMVKIGIVGEIYTVLEPSTNYNIVSYLGRLNTETIRCIYTSDWLNDHICRGWLKKSNHKQIISKARPYINYWVGGHGRETVGYTVDLAGKYCDGVIQIGPLTCMPEIIAQSVLGHVSEKEDIPCMTLYFDQHAGTAGVYTRLEAYIDMLHRKRFGSGNITVSS